MIVRTTIQGGVELGSTTAASQRWAGKRRAFHSRRSVFKQLFCSGSISAHDSATAFLSQIRNVTLLFLVRPPNRPHSSSLCSALSDPHTRPLMRRHPAPVGSLCAEVVRPNPYGPFPIVKKMLAAHHNVR